MSRGEDGLSPMGSRPPSRQQKKKKHKRKAPISGKDIFWAFYKVLAVVSALIVFGYLGFRFLVPKPEQKPVEPPPPSSSQVVVDPVGDSSVDSSQEQDPEPVVEPLIRRENVYNIFLAATDKEGIRTDTMMVVSYDIDNQKVGVISIPRDTLTKREAGKNPKLVYGSGNVAQRREDISNMLGIPIDYYIKININAFVELVDYLGGVEFYVPCDMDYDDPFQDLSIHYKEGWTTLNGQQAMEVARFRKNNPDENGIATGYNDVGRTQTQQKLLIALAKKVLSWNSLTKVNGFVEIFKANVSTDLSLQDMLYFASQAIYVDLSTGVETATLPGRGDGIYKNHTYCYALDPVEAVDTINRLVNPYQREMTLEDTNIVLADGYMEG